MEKLIGNRKVFMAASALFALATLYNVTSGNAVSSSSTHLSVMPANQPTIQSGPAVMPTASKPVSRS